MSFRTRLTSFFILIVIVPMIAIGFLVFRLISQSEQGKADARASGLATAAASIYRRDSAAANVDAATLARAVNHLRGPALNQRVRLLATRAGLTRVTVSAGSRTLVDVGSTSAVAPGVADLQTAGGPLRITASEVTAADYAR